MTATIRWGILGTGAIAGAFARALGEADGAELAAVGSRSADTARRFATEHGAARAHGSYGSLAADSGVDAIYIATPHAFHMRDTLLCLEHGKHVLCEKPFALNTAQAQRMVACARTHDRLVMEAMWTRFLPSIRFAEECLASGVVGEPLALIADFGFRVDVNPASRLFAPALGGGALLDLGVYAVSMGHRLFGPPEELHGLATLGVTGVDESSTVAMRHAEGRLTSVFQSLRMATPCEARITCTAGALLLHAPWWGCGRVTVLPQRSEPVTHDFPLRGAGYAPMAEAFMELLREGRRNAGRIPAEESIAIMTTLDALRAPWGLRYPGEPSI